LTFSYSLLLLVLLLLSALPCRHGMTGGRTHTAGRRRSAPPDLATVVVCLLSTSPSPAAVLALAWALREVALRIMGACIVGLFEEAPWVRTVRVVVLPAKAAGSSRRLPFYKFPGQQHSTF
jgi:hypothetical protein